MTFTFFTLRPFGVLTMNKIMIGKSVCMLTTGKILGANTSYTFTTTSLAKNGTKRPQLRIIRMDVLKDCYAGSHTVGKRVLITLKCIRSILAPQRNVRKNTVLIIITRMKSAHLIQRGLSLFQGAELLTFLPLFTFRLSKNSANLSRSWAVSSKPSFQRWCKNYGLEERKATAAAGAQKNVKNNVPRQLPVMARIKALRKISLDCKSQCGLMTALILQYEPIFLKGRDSSSSLKSRKGEDLHLTCPKGLFNTINWVMTMTTSQRARAQL